MNLPRSSFPALRPVLQEAATWRLAAEVMLDRSPLPRSWPWPVTPVEALADALSAHGVPWAPYGVLRQLEAQGVEAHTSLSDTISLQGHQILRETHQRREREWVRQQGLTPQCELGYRGKHQERAFTVVGIDRQRARYELLFDDAPDQERLLPFEAIHPLGEPPERFALRVQ
jgi:hypothetical protein